MCWVFQKCHFIEFNSSVVLVQLVEGQTLKALREKLGSEIKMNPIECSHFGVDAGDSLIPCYIFKAVNSLLLQDRNCKTLWKDMTQATQGSNMAQ